MTHLLESDVNIANLDLSMSMHLPIRLDELRSEISSQLCKYDSIARYFAWKYNMNEFEHHLLQTELRGIVAEYAMKRIYRTFEDVYKPKDLMEMPTDEYMKLIESKDVQEWYSVISGLLTPDYAFLMMPHRNILQVLAGDCLSGFAYEHGSTRLEILERLYNRTLDYVWRKRTTGLPKK